ncbi:hypothetical protein [Maribellus maritimus]|uniref:hypothetical protein n=1 Tax=Maribellus maritimus TaxID=2870838 RepID=UPI001EEBAF3D|nr:hypothetical protein [Maribellus maritimus]MCG6189563.1 hypothetical protein [Maribellus maritimus]
MKNKIFSVIITVFIGIEAFAQTGENEAGKNKYYQLYEGSENSGKYRVELSSDIDSTWNKWSNDGYNFGFDKNITPMYTNVNGILSTNYMIQVRGNENEWGKKRWGYHVFEGYAKDDKSRITMLVNKHVEVDKPVAEMYYYGTVYNHSESAYNWLRIGSDVKQHSFLFSRDKAIFYGSLKLSNALTLGRIGYDNIRSQAPEGDDEKNSEESAMYVNYKALKNSEDGTIFYDKDNNIVVIKIEGEWRKIATEALPQGVSYDF